MTEQKIKNLLEAPISLLKESAMMMNDDVNMDDSAFEILLNILEKRMSERDFILFCNQMSDSE